MYEHVQPTNKTDISRKETSVISRSVNNNTSTKVKSPGLSHSVTGAPDNMMAGIEASTGIPMDDVRVHYNSDKPAQLNAKAFTKGSDIHIAPGQESSLGHELGHVVQQKQGRVKPTLQFKGVDINDDLALEREADEIAKKATQFYPNATGEYIQFLRTNQYSGVVQGKFGEVVQMNAYWEIDGAGNVLDPKPTKDAPANAAHYKAGITYKQQRMYNNNADAKNTAATATGVGFAITAKGVGLNTLNLPPGFDVTNAANSAAANIANDGMSRDRALKVGDKFYEYFAPPVGAAGNAVATAGNVAGSQHKAINELGVNYNGANNTVKQAIKDMAKEVSDGLTNQDARVHVTQQTGADLGANGMYYYFTHNGANVLAGTPVLIKHTDDNKSVIKEYDNNHNLANTHNKVNHWHAGVTKVANGNVGTVANPAVQPKYQRTSEIDHYFIKP